MRDDIGLSLDELRAHVEKEGIHPSYHRLKILEYLMSHKTHPTVERIHKELSKEIPTLSKTTVYNTLNLFVSKGIVQELTIEEKEVRYDADTKKLKSRKIKIPKTNRKSSYWRRLVCGAMFRTDSVVFHAG
jgi:Fe2+ or Zn2+ uptake regulation protein